METSIICEREKTVLEEISGYHVDSGPSLLPPLKA